jgi:uncharacterized phiE125 gp8 family phage protein
MEHLGFDIIAGPAIEVITLAEAKLACRIDTGDSSHDTDLRRLIAAARSAIELALGVSIGQQTIEDTHDFWPACFHLRRHPVHSISSIKYVDDDDVEYTVDSAIYFLDSVREPRVVLKSDETWTDDALRPAAAIKVRYVCGYGEELSVTADATGDTLGASAHGLYDGQDVLLRATTVPGGLAVDTRYWVRDAAANTFKVAATMNGTAIDITSAGSGVVVAAGIPDVIRQQILFLVAQWFDVPTPVLGNTLDKAAPPVPNTITWLGSNTRRWGF